MALSADQVRHIAKLARLQIGDDEVEKYAKELTGILAVIDKLTKVNTEGVPPTVQVTGLTNVLRPDVIRTTGAAPDDLLATSPLPIIAHQIETPSAHAQ